MLETHAYDIHMHMIYIHRVIYTIRLYTTHTGLFVQMYLLAQLTAPADSCAQLVYKLSPKVAHLDGGT